jgi:GNAT superfamily N-acetyltransferase
MFVRGEFRNRRIGAAILKGIEEIAIELGGRHCILETGIRQPEAISLYKREGYDVIPNFGQYAEIETSVCMKKELSYGKSESFSKTCLD